MIRNDGILEISGIEVRPTMIDEVRGGTCFVMFIPEDRLIYCEAKDNVHDDGKDEC